MFLLLLQESLSEGEIQFFKSGVVHVNAGGRIHLVLFDSL